MGLPQPVLTELIGQGSENGAALRMRYLARLPFPLPSARRVLCQGAELALWPHSGEWGLPLPGCGKGALR